MRLHRFFGNFDFSKDIITVIDTGLLSQWHNVLRLGNGDSVILCDGAGYEGEAIIDSIDKRKATLIFKNKRKVQREPQKAVTLFAALLKRENFEIIVQKATEIGIEKIVPIQTARTVKTGFNHARLEKIIREAAEQSGRTIIPEISEPITFSKALETIDAKKSVLFDSSGSELKQNNSLQKITNCFIGPEGGFSEEEVSLAKKSGMSIASLGELTLRAETAAIVSCFILCQNL